MAFAGLVAGRGVIVVAHPGGLRTSYEPVSNAAVVGALVRRGERIGVVAGVAGHCAPATCLHWGLRRGETYLDPLTLLRAVPPVLKPLTVSPRAHVGLAARVGGVAPDRWQCCSQSKVTR